MESVEQPLIPGLPDDLALRCLARLSHGHHGVLKTVSKRWRDLIRSVDYANYKSEQGWLGSWLFVLLEDPENQWMAYDPEAQRWHPMPENNMIPDGCSHCGFSCVCVSSRLLLIGGLYALSFHEHSVTNDVMQFDPFKKEWTRRTSMETPRAHFACSVLSGKVYVAGGGANLAEVYDPVTDRWEELPAMPKPMGDCQGISYNGKFHVFSDYLLSTNQKGHAVFDPSNKTWCTEVEFWPFSGAVPFSVQVTEDGRVYTAENAVDGDEMLIKTKDTKTGEWYTVGSVPQVLLPPHSQAVTNFRYWFLAVRNELYIVGGGIVALKQRDETEGAFEYMSLGLVIFCNPSDRPLKWREARRLCKPDCGFIRPCASMEENSS